MSEGEERLTERPAPTGLVWRRHSGVLGLVLLLPAAAAVGVEQGGVALPLDPRPFALALGIASLAVLSIRANTGGARRWLMLPGVFAAALVSLLALKLLLFSYAQQRVVLDAGEGVALHGTLLEPRGEGHFPAILILPGDTDRQLLAWHARLLARSGFAVLECERREVDRGGGLTPDLPYEDMAEDALACLRWLTSRPEIDRLHLGVLAHGDGGRIAPIVVARYPELAFLAVTSTTDLSPAQQVVYETGRAVADRGFRQEKVDWAIFLQKRVMDYVRTGQGRGELQSSLDESAAEPWFAVSGLPQRLGEPESYERWRALMDFDPPAYWRQVRVPVLAISGALDTRSDVFWSQAGIKAALVSGGNDAFRGEVIEGVGHGFTERWLPWHLPPSRYTPRLRYLLLEWLREVAGTGS